jgi:hypothetical protein
MIYVFPIWVIGLMVVAVFELMLILIIPVSGAQEF